MAAASFKSGVSARPAHAYVPGPTRRQLEPSRCHRLNPALENVVSQTQARGDAIEELREKAIATGEEADLTATFRWIEASGWMDDDAEEAKPAAARPVARRRKAPAARSEGGN